MQNNQTISAQFQRQSQSRIGGAGLKRSSTDAVRGKSASTAGSQKSGKGKSPPSCVATSALQWSGGQAHCISCSSASHGWLRAVIHPITAVEKHILEQFDFDTKFGPCMGMTRMERCAKFLHCVTNVQVKTSDMACAAGQAMGQLIP